MKLTRADVVRYLYTAGVLMSGALLGRAMIDVPDPVLLGPVAVVALVWTVYYRVWLRGRIEHLETEE